VALAPALPQLVALTHLRAGISMSQPEGNTQNIWQGVFSAQGVPLEAPPCLQQLCPGLKSLILDVKYDTGDTGDTEADLLEHRMDVPVADLLPDHLEQLHISMCSACPCLGVRCITLAPFTSLRCLTLASVEPVELDLLLTMPGLEELASDCYCCWVDGRRWMVQEWLTSGLSSATPEHLTKLKGICIRHLEPDISPLELDLVAQLPMLRQLEVVVLRPGGAAWVQQLSGLARLQHLTLAFDAGATSDVGAVVSALSSVQQLTYLYLNNLEEVQASTWAAVLPHLTRLRVLGVTKQLLLEGGLAAEVHKLQQLQSLYVTCYPDDTWHPAAIGADMGQHMRVLSKCITLRDVVCWSYPRDGTPAAHPLWGFVYAGRLHLSCWHKLRNAAEEGRVVCPRPCPHLPGVWQLRQDPAGGQDSA
jgi:hypothetical protein